MFRWSAPGRSSMGAKRRRVSIAGAVTAAAAAILAAAAVVLAAQGVVSFAEHDPQKPEAPVLTAAVTVGQVLDQVQVEADVVTQFAWQPHADGVVTRDGLRVGQSAVEGETIAVVNERPLFLFLGSVPMYRPLGKGAIGDDVHQLQAALQRLGYDVENDGEFGFSTARAVFNLYTDKGFLPVGPGGDILEEWQDWLAGVPAAEATFAPAVPVVASTQCGHAMSDISGSLCTLTAGLGTLVVEVPKSEAPRVTPGLAVSISMADGTTVDGHIEAPYAVQGAQADGGEEGSTSDEDQDKKQENPRFKVVLDEGDAPQVGASGTGAITVKASAEDAMRIEATAVREDSQGVLWLLDTKEQRIDISVGVCSAGLCEISGDQVRANLQVVVPSGIEATQSAEG